MSAGSFQARVTECQALFCYALDIFSLLVSFSFLFNYLALFVFSHPTPRTTIMRRIRFSRCPFPATVLGSDLEAAPCFHFSTSIFLPLPNTLFFDCLPSTPSTFPLFPWPHSALRLVVSQIIDALLFFRLLLSSPSSTLHAPSGQGVESAPFCSCRTCHLGFCLLSSRPIPNCRFLPSSLDDDYRLLTL